MPHQEAHQLKPGVTGSPDDCNFDLVHHWDQSFRSPFSPEIIGGKRIKGEKVKRSNGQGSLFPFSPLALFPFFPFSG
jgi:hypothetical protein